MGMINETGNLFIIGRIKEILVTAGGENVAPYPIENRVMKEISDFASWAVAIGDGRQFISMLICIKNAHDPSQVPSEYIEADARKALKKRGIFVEKISELFQKKNFKILSEIVRNAINKCNQASISRAAKIKDWRLLDRDFSIATDELTPTFKLKRPKVEKHFKKVIDEIYMKPKA